MDEFEECNIKIPDRNLPMDYSLTSQELGVLSVTNEAKIITHSKSMKLNFGVERLLSKSSDNDKKIYENKNTAIVDFVTSDLELDSNANCSQGLNLLQQQLINTNLNGLNNQNCLLKPYPLRFGKSHNGEHIIN